MRKIKISPSLLEQFRLVRAGMYNLGTESLVEYITGEYKPNEATSRGTAYHRMLEEGPEKFLQIYNAKEGVDNYVVYEKELGKVWKFSAQAVEPILAIREFYAAMIHEAWGRYEVQVNGFQVIMNQRYDRLMGYDIHEFKTGSRAKKYSDYYASLQWRCYMLALPDVERVHYHHFYLDSKNTWCKPEHFTFNRDETVEDQVMDNLRALVSWLELRPDLLQCLEIKD